MSELGKNETHHACVSFDFKKYSWYYYLQRSAIFSNYPLHFKNNLGYILIRLHTDFSIPTRKLREIIIGHKWFSISSWIRMACTGFVMKCYCCRIYSVDGIYKRFYSFVKWKDILTYWNKIKYENTNKYSF